jgi:hypothetical protein
MLSTREKTLYPRCTRGIILQGMAKPEFKCNACRKNEKIPLLYSKEICKTPLGISRELLYS